MRSFEKNDLLKVDVKFELKNSLKSFRLFEFNFAEKGGRYRIQKKNLVKV